MGSGSPASVGQELALLGIRALIGTILSGQVTPGTTRNRTVYLQPFKMLTLCIVGREHTI